MTVQEYNQCVEDFADGVYRFILKNLRDAERARDIVQDTFEKLWVRVAEINASKVKSYLFTTAYHTMIDSIRKHRMEHDLDEVDHAGQATGNAYSDLKEVLNDALAKLNDIQRSVVLLRDYEGYSYEEIGQITGLNESQVKVYIYRARLTLKEYIGSLDRVL